jgi:hypothetical protein
MTQTAVWTKWKFIVQSEDEETGEPSATIGQAETREECEALIEYDFDYHRLRGREIVDAEVCEICAECGGEGLIAAGNDGQVICPACDGHHGPLRKDQGQLSSLSAPGGQRERSFGKSGSPRVYVARAKRNQAREGEGDATTRANSHSIPV